MKSKETLEKAQIALIQGNSNLAEELLNESNEQNAVQSSDRQMLFLQLGSAFRAVKEPEKALQSFQAVLKEAPDNVDALLNVGQILFESEQYDESSRCFRKLTELQPDNASVWLTYGYILTLREKYRDAVNALKKALELDRQSADACFHLAESLRKDERFEESFVYYQRLVKVASDYPQAIHGYGKSLLGAGNLEFGWDAMEFRKTYLFGTWEQHYLPEWNGKTTEDQTQDQAKDQTLLVYSEEGIAADIMFASCLPDVIDSTEIKHCVVECDASLHNLFKRSFPKATFVPLSSDPVDEQNSWGIPLNCQTAFGSLPRFFRRSVDSFPLRKSYLIPDKEKIEKWSNRLAQIGSVPKIGFLWQGSWTAETERQTFLPLFELRNLMMKHPGKATWVNLQNGSKQKELDAYRRNVSLPIRQFDEAFQYDLDEMAALLVSLDLIITPPGYVAQLAAAVGAKTWLVLPERADWRWNLGTENVLWHPFVKSYRKGLKQSWSSLFQTLNGDLEKMLQTRRPPIEESTEDAPATLKFPVKQRPLQYPLRKVA